MRCRIVRLNRVQVLFIIKMRGVEAGKRGEVAQNGGIDTQCDLHYFHWISDK